MFVFNNMDNSDDHSIDNILLTPVGAQGTFWCDLCSVVENTLICGMLHALNPKLSTGIVINCDSWSTAINQIVAFWNGINFPPRVPTTGEELQPDGGDQLALQGLREGALCVLDADVSLFDPSQQPQQVAVTQ